PDHGADQQHDGRLVDVDAATAGLDALGDEHDRQRVGDGVQEPRELPPGEPADQVDVALDDAGEADQLTPKLALLLAPKRVLFGVDHAGTFSSSSWPSSSSRSSSNSRPVAFRNACSSVSAR